MKKYICSLLLVFTYNFCSAQETNPFYNSTIEEYKRKKFEEKLQADSQRRAFEYQRQKMLSELERMKKSVQNAKENPEAFDMQKALDDLEKKLNPDKPTLQAAANQGDISYLDTNAALVLENSSNKQPSPSMPQYVSPNAEHVPINQSKFERFANSPCFQTLGYIPDDPDLEERYRNCEESKRNDQIAKVGLVVVLITGLLAAVWFVFSKANIKGGSKVKVVR